MINSRNDIPEFSIIIPCYNCDKYLSKNIGAILSSNLNQFSIEILAIDDNSSDNTINVLQELQKKDSRLKVFENNISLGPNFSRNIGIQNSRGNYIIFLDSDDEFRNESLCDVFLNVLKHKSDIAVFGINFLSEKQISSKRFVYQNKKMSGVEALNIYLNGGMTTVCWNKIYSRDFLYKNELQFIEDRIHGRDAIFTLTCLIKSKKVHLSEIILVNSLIRPDSFSRTYSLSNVKSALVIIEEVEKICDNNLISSKEYSLFIIKYINYSIVVSIFRLGKYSDFKDAVLIIKRNPLVKKVLRNKLVNFNRASMMLRVILRHPFVFHLLGKLFKKFNFHPY